MEHRHQRESETLCNNAHIAQSEITFVELMIADALFDNVVNELFDLRWRRLFQATWRAFHCISQTDNCAFFRLRLRAAVAETFLSHFRNIVLAHFHDFAAGARVPYSPASLVMMLPPME